MTAFNLSTLTPAQRALVETAIHRARSYDFTRCLPALRAQWGKAAIDVVFSDLSRFSAVVVAHAAGEVDDTHVHAPNGAVGHPIQHRHQVLGLAWSNGKIELDASLESQSELAQEVFLSEGAHICDWLDPGMTPAARERIWDALHANIGADIGSDIGDHGHSWFDVGAYETWVGESFMSLFTAATSDVAVTLTQFTHKPTPEAITVARELLDIDADVDVTLPRYFATKRGKTFHDSHKGIAADRTFATRALAVAAGLRPCGVCKP